MDIFNNAKKLGFGLMRLPLLDPNDAASIDIETMKKMVDSFMEQGFTYFDTAILYCGMKSQNAVKDALSSRYPRDSYTLATKMHYGFFDSYEDQDRVFAEQLEACGVDFFDYYLVHDIGANQYAKYERCETFKWLAKKKEEGKVKHMGFSFHDNAEFLDKVLTDHPETEFVQLQLNYLDWESEGVQSRKCYEVCQKHGKPVVVMEPVRGGTLAQVPKPVEDLFKSKAPDMSVPSWAIRFAATHENVKMVLSGMSNMEQMLDNTGYMKDFKPLDKDEMDTVFEAVDIIKRSVAISCTSCSYCTEGCPKNIPIPRYFALYNLDIIEKDQEGWRPQGSYYERLTENFGKASDCVACRKCESICPQHLHIVDSLKTVAEHFE